DCGSLLARKVREPDAYPNLRHRLGGPKTTSRIPGPPQGTGKAGPPPPRSRARSVPFRGRQPRPDILARQGLDNLPRAPKFRPAEDLRPGLPGGKHAFGHAEISLGPVGALGKIQREHVPDREREASVCPEAHELPRPHRDFPPRPQVLPGPAAAYGRIRLLRTKRSFRRPARAYARSRFRPGRCAYILHRR